MPEFHPVAKVSDVAPGEARMYRVANRSVGLYNVGGTFFAIEDICAHRGGTLSQGDVDGDVVTCPLHGWRYNVRTGQGCDFPQAKVATFPVAINGDQVSIGI